MAVYKVPQDVEAEDKLIGPFSFKQFVFLMIAAIGVGMAYALSRLLMPLAIIPMPIIIFFGILALPIRKDQPMEVYLAAVVSFLTRPKIRLWRPDGIESLIEVVAPRRVEQHLGKDYSADEVHRRLSYLADIADSGGWSIRGVHGQTSILREDLYHEAQAADDLLDESGNRAKQINDLLDQSNNRRRQQLIENMQNPQLIPQPAQSAPAPQLTAPAPQATTISYDIPNYTPSDPYQKLVSPVYTPMSAIQPTHPDEDIRLVVNPYPVINQAVLTPLSELPNTQSDSSDQATAQPQQPAVTEDPAQQAPVQQPKPEPAPSVEPISPAIIDLANNHKDLSIETLGREANRIKQKELNLKENEEILISLR